ncbi:MAG: type II toxin-antitoxin system VapC family toxin [Chloroflexi bacterium]|nr:type II toxin-antitoxin system VapC family toxin [Chloroflexota bacterium]
MRLIDTSVFIYAVGRPHEFKEVCARLSREFLLGEHDVNIDTELLQEVLYHFWRRGRHVDGIELVDRIMAGLPEPFPVTLREVRVGRDVLLGHPQLSPRDAIHAAVVMVHGLEGIISTDRAFDAIPAVRRFDPKEL